MKSSLLHLTHLLLHWTYVCTDASNYWWSICIVVGISFPHRKGLLSSRQKKNNSLAFLTLILGCHILGKMNFHCACMASYQTGKDPSGIIHISLTFYCNSACNTQFRLFYDWYIYTLWWLWVLKKSVLTGVNKSMCSLKCIYFYGVHMEKVSIFGYAGQA